MRINDIKFALKHLVGWEQSYNPAHAIDTALTKSESGLTFNGAHPLVTIENLRAIMPDEFNLKYPQWNMLINYKAGNKVAYNGLIWIAKIDNVNQEPTASDFNDDFSRDDFGNPFWKPYNSLSDFLETMVDNGIANVVTTFVQMKQLEKETRTLLQRKTFFDGAGRIKHTTQNNHKIVGFELIPVRAMGVTAKIERVGLQMTGSNGMVRLYLFHSSQAKPIKHFDLHFTVKNGGFQWFSLENCYLPYISEENNAGGAWYLCYNQDELPKGMEAINVSKDWSREPCGTCNIGSVETWREVTKYLQISPFKVDAPTTFEEYPELWDITDNIYTNTFNYGLNCEMSVECDLTDFIITQRHIFAPVVQKQVAYTALRTLALNPDVRVNRNQSNASRMDILYELDGNTNSSRQNGLGYELKKAYEALSIDTRGIDRVCLACNNKGVKYSVC